MVRQDKISIIMPVYNAGAYVEQAIQSVLAQTYPHFELLLVDDGSTDESLHICRMYEKKDTRIHVYENESKVHGAGAAREIALKKAIGEYLTFLDADDWMEANLLEDALHTAKVTGAQMIQYGIWEEHISETIEKPLKMQGVFTKLQMNCTLIDCWRKMRWELWTTLFHRSCVEGLHFEMIPVGEDHCFYIDAMSKAEIFAFMKQSLYHYRVREDSTFHRWQPKLVHCNVQMYLHEMYFLQSMPGKVEAQVWAEFAFTRYIWVIYQMCQPHCPWSAVEKRKQLRQAAQAMSMKIYKKSYRIPNDAFFEKWKRRCVKHNLEIVLLFLGKYYVRYFG